MTDQTRHSLSPASLEPRFTVLHLQILLHYYGTSRPYSENDPAHAFSAAVMSYRKQLVNDGFIIPLKEAQCFGITERGRGLVRELARVWVDEKGKPVNGEATSGNDKPVNGETTDKPEPEKSTILWQIDALRQTIPPDIHPNEHKIAHTICDLFEAIYAELTGRIDAHKAKLKEHEKSLIQIMMGQIFGMGKGKPDPVLDALLSKFWK